MRIDIISAVPPLLASPLDESLIKRARDNGIVEIVIHNLRDYGLGKYHQIDDDPFGGGAGMVLRVEPIFTLIRELQSQRTYDEIIFLTPEGKTFKQEDANQLSLKIIFCFFAEDIRALMSVFVRHSSRKKFPLAIMYLPAASFRRLL